MPCPWSASVVMGPIDTTTVLPRSASRSASARPISAATRNRLSAWWALVNSATSTSPAANRSMAALRGSHVLGQRTPVHLASRDARAAQPKPGQQLVVARVVLLSGDALARDRELAVQLRKQVAP